MTAANQQLIQMALIALAAVSAIVVLFGLYTLIRRIFARGMRKRLER